MTDFLSNAEEADAILAGHGRPLEKKPDGWCYTPTKSCRATEEDRYWMRICIRLGVRARERGEKPFGCVVVSPFSTLAHTMGTGSRFDPTVHSEILAIRLAVERYESLSILRDCAIYSTHEPCVMCCGAINHAKLSRVVWGSYRVDLPQLFLRKTPAEQLLRQTSHPPVAFGGVLRDECAALFEGVEKWD